MDQLQVPEGKDPQLWRLAHKRATFQYVSTGDRTIDNEYNRLLQQSQPKK